ncbi:AraC family transcriptional regulator [uncultured Alistipes sp.]|uniref:helix-turn-helix domain-containing protein n=1 Tax=uncultured Alistipes sp. TaxID=538949 RepID=UPI0026071D43|nr:AraC family transcriptional regulator [uncultured Alistipes sp.]
MRRQEPMKLLFNYNDVFFSFIYDDEEPCAHRSRDYALNYVRSGEMVLDNGRERIRVGKGECVFIPRDHHVTFYKRPCDGERYCGIFLSFTRAFLRRMYALFGQRDVAPATPKLEARVMKLPATAELASLFGSMTPYFDPEVKPRGDFMQLKMQEGLLALLHIDERFGPLLFDFNQPWKIDILEFLEENYMCEFTMEELAHYTGRSLATFKRDFRKISDLTPGKWLVRRRLEEAYARMKEGGCKVVDVYAEVGFKNASHFSTAFKRHYGVSPSALFA